MTENIRFSCPCCSYLTMPEAAHQSYHICPVCFWEDDPVQFENCDLSGGANHLSLDEARANYAAIKASDPRFLAEVRPPLLEEFPSNDPADQPSPEPL